MIYTARDHAHDGWCYQRWRQVGDMDMPNHFFPTSMHGSFLVSGQEFMSPVSDRVTTLSWPVDFLGKNNTRWKNKRSFGLLVTTTAHHKALLLQAFQRFGTLKNSIWITRVDDNELKTNKDRSRVSWWHRYFSALLGWTPGSAVVKTLTREVLRFRHQALSVSDTCSLGSPFVYFPSLFFHRVNHLKLEAFSMEAKQSTPRLLKQLWFTSTLDGE